MEEFQEDPQPILPAHPPVQPATVTPAPAFKSEIDELIYELRQIAFYDIAEMYDEQNCLLPVQSMCPGIRRAIASIDTEELYAGSGHARELIGYTKKVKLIDKKGAIEICLRKLGAFVEKIEQKHTLKTMNVDLSGKTPEELIRILNGSD
jgi:phage terminase small subunit